MDTEVLDNFIKILYFSVIMCVLIVYTKPITFFTNFTGSLWALKFANTQSSIQPFLTTLFSIYN